MSSDLLHPVVEVIVSAILGLALLVAFSRAVRGPRAEDRIAVLDFLSGVFLCLAAWQAIRRAETVWLDVGLLLAVVSFAGTCALARHLDRSPGPDDPAR